MNFKKTFSLSSESRADPNAVRIKDDLRITVLTDRLFRIEKGTFTDAATQTVLFRNFTPPVFRIRENGKSMVISTEKAALCIDAESGKLIYAKTRDCGKIDRLSGNLKGTYRTLDMTAGFAPLGDGILSKDGVAVLDDSKTLLLNPDGTISPRKNCSDKYYFAYGRNYREALKDFYRLTGATPLLPRYCLGNWWSRYWAYTQEEYLALIDRFQEESIPICVATVDMDWHWVDVVKRYGKEASIRNIKRAKGEYQRMQSSGWTGYSWNTELFPDYKAFLQALHDKGLKTTLNLHPASGVQFFEDQYEEMAKAMGIDPATKEHVPFDITDPKFTAAYFEFLHHGYEKDGVDFWWIDWQQGRRTKIPGLDPLWALNHYHYLDSCKNNKRGLILSRYAGPGSHRYPLGFSGDTVICRKSLDFQPYFTATASNIGYSWWSHDIGGHHMGVHDDELYIRWLQLGVFSPINRLHSTSDPFMGKEPWNYRRTTEEIAKKWLRLRKKLIPYIYTANYMTHTDGKPLIEPMYYEYPWVEDAYRVKNQYLFGGDLIVAPITEKTDPQTGLAGTDVFLDGKRYTDFFTGEVYRYQGVNRMYRDLHSIPVLAKEGAIIPTDGNAFDNGARNPSLLVLHVFSGNGSYTLYEDDGESLAYKNGAYMTQTFTVKETEASLRFVIFPPDGDRCVAPTQRSMQICFRNVRYTPDAVISVSGTDTFTTAQSDTARCLTVTIDRADQVEPITVEIKEPQCLIRKTRQEKLLTLLSGIQGNNLIKSAAFSNILKTGKLPSALPQSIKGAIREIFLQQENE